jgi:hypothetical protein
MSEKEPRKNNSSDKPKPQDSHSNSNNTSTNDPGIFEVRKGLNDNYDTKDAKKTKDSH